MNRLIVILLTILLYPTLGICSSYKEQWKKASGYYMQKQYDSAVYYFELIAAKKPHNAEVYYNLGNAYYRLNKIAPAVLNYERALHIKPTYKEAQDNLGITQARISHNITSSDDVFFIKWWKSLTASTNASGWAIGAAIIFILFIASIWINRFHKAKLQLPFQLPGIFVFMCCSFLIFAFISAGNKANSPKAVVTENDTPLLKKSLKGKPITQIPEGVTVTINEQNEGWAEVTLPDGRTGWLLLTQISKI